MRLGGEPLMRGDHGGHLVVAGLRRRKCPTPELDSVSDEVGGTVFRPRGTPLALVVMPSL